MWKGVNTTSKEGGVKKKTSCRKQPFFFLLFFCFFFLCLFVWCVVVIWEQKISRSNGNTGKPCLLGLNCSFINFVFVAKWRSKAIFVFSYNCGSFTLPALHLLWSLRKTWRNAFQVGQHKLGAHPFSISIFSMLTTGPWHFLDLYQLCCSLQTPFLSLSLWKLLWTFFQARTRLIASL